MPYKNTAPGFFLDYFVSFFEATFQWQTGHPDSVIIPLFLCRHHRNFEEIGAIYLHFLHRVKIKMKTNESDTMGGRLKGKGRW